MDSTEIRALMPVVCSEDGQIKFARDKSGQHHFIPASWVTRMDDKVHVDRPGQQTMRVWKTEAPVGC